MPFQPLPMISPEPPAQPVQDPFAAPTAPAPQAPDFSRVPAEMNFDQAFGLDAQGNPVSQAPAVAPQGSQPAPWFIEAPTGTKYRTAEEAIAGIAQKDTFIQEQQRQLADAQRTMQFYGITAPGQLRPQAPAAPPQPMALDVIEASINQNNPALFQQYFQQEVRRAANEVVQQQFHDVQPLINNANVGMALEAAARIEPNIPAFVRSPEFAATVAKLPRVLQDGLKLASENVQFKHQLPELYVMAYQLARALQPSQPVPQAQHRPTMPSTTPGGVPLTVNQGALVGSRGGGSAAMDIPLEVLFGVSS